MKKSGIINPDLARELAALGHYDAFVICDMDFPIPRDAVRIDLTLVAGVPRFLPVLRACLREVAVQEMVLLEGIKTANPELDQAIGALRTHQELRYVSLPEFRNQAKGAAFYVRTGETLPCSNIYLVSASGVAERAAYYDIAIEAAEV